MKKLRAAVCLLLVLTIFSTQASAWSNPGHMAVALIAYRNLTPATKARVDKLVAMNPFFLNWSSKIPAGTAKSDRPMLLFAIAATWPDQIKFAKGYKTDGALENGKINGDKPPTDGSAGRNTGYDDFATHKYWHFIDIPFSPDHTHLLDPDTPNVETQIDVFRGVLASDAKDGLKSYDLVWLLHLVGDIHQPLHATSRFIAELPGGDNGGNLIKICDPQCGKGHELHAFWDHIFGSTNDLTLGLQLAITAAAHPAIVSKSLSNDLDVSHWVEESFNEAKKSVYATPIENGTGPYIIPATRSSYRNNAIAVGNVRIALAGARLANILNKELK